MAAQNKDLLHNNRYQYNRSCSSKVIEELAGGECDRLRLGIKGIRFKKLCF